ncbi:MAG: GntR family transcriptional regulator [Hydrogenophaga sp.]|uniref:GntR family transcriptional regulator n=1 Tax=Hydrogenophaga sp. TaxID=1904254 RepID=UPI0025B7F2E2|nr:GntR family transcriptional regulator [Hydrogenophaga sp.]MBU7573294.1 GntR family transcriptional regulator [Hydrogenophaga sp.]
MKPLNDSPQVSSRPLTSALDIGTATYVKLLMRFRRRIESGEWPVDGQIPSLEALVEETGVARATVRHALSFLESEGLIGRYRGRGTFVLRRPVSEVFYDIPTDWHTLVDQTPQIDIEWLATATVNDAIPVSHPGGTLAPGGYQYFRRLQRHNQIPYFLGISYLEQGLFKKTGKKPFNTPAPMRVLQKHAGDRLGRAEQTITATTADPEISTLLQLAIHAPVMVVSRTVFDVDQVVIYESTGIFRADFVRVRNVLREGPG